MGRILDVAARQANACRDAADQLAYLHGELEDTRVPAYDVPTALEVLQTGTLPAPQPSCYRRAALFTPGASNWWRRGNSTLKLPAMSAQIHAGSLCQPSG